MTKIITLGEYASMIQKNITWVSLCLIKFSFKNRKEYNDSTRIIQMIDQLIWKGNMIKKDLLFMI